MAHLPPEEYPILTIEGGLATITFNRPDKFNAFHLEQVPILRALLIEVEQNPEVRCLLFHPAAGADSAFRGRRVVDARGRSPGYRMGLPSHRHRSTG